ncbi:hypothetical protein RJ55_08100 [Drechmeria coniospora]|nr:hypothetical protein RJ55_08100 [Drechmeria coniospora]
MSAPDKKANLARIRDNQRRSRARKKEYLQDLERRVRLWELYGTEASAEIQMAARKVAEENKQLRCLLNRYGVGDEYIHHYLQSGTVIPPSSPQGQPFRAGDPGPTVLSLQQLMQPRLPPAYDRTVQMAQTSQSSRETSMTSASTTSSSLWEPTQTMASSYGHQARQQMTLSPPAVDPPPHAPYSPPNFATTAATPRRLPFSGHASPSMLNDPRQAVAPTAQPMLLEGRATMGYQYMLPQYDDLTARNYGPSARGC